MKKVIIGAVVVIALSTVLLSACGRVKTPEETHVSTTVTEYNISQAVNAFNPVNGWSETTTEIFEKITQAVNTTIRKDELTERKTEKLTTGAPPTSRQTVKVTVNEGDTLTQIFRKLDENGVADFDALMKTAQSYDYSYYPLVADIPSNPNRCFRLEGYLFPDTYEFYLNQKPQDAIGKFLRNGKVRITDSMKSQAKALGYSMDEILTVASIIEKEGANANEVSRIAAVIYNRLEAGMKLQMDSSIYYIERHVKPYISGDINRYNSYYNTYKCSALPAGPISNPGIRTINAALNPADVDYLYFCHDENANYYYADTYEEHQENLKKAGL